MAKSQMVLTIRLLNITAFSSRSACSSTLSDVFGTNTFVYRVHQLRLEKVNLEPGPEDAHVLVQTPSGDAARRIVEHCCKRPFGAF